MHEREESAPRVTMKNKKRMQSNDRNKRNFIGCFTIFFTGVV